MHDFNHLISPHGTVTVPGKHLMRPAAQRPLGRRPGVGHRCTLQQQFHQVVGMAGCVFSLLAFVSWRCVLGLGLPDSAVTASTGWQAAVTGRFCAESA